MSLLKTIPGRILQIYGRGGFSLLFSKFYRFFLKYFFDRYLYRKWIERNEHRSNDLENFRKNLKVLRYLPKISIILPVYDPPLNYLNQAINSVRNQLYQNWQLCISDDCSKNPEVDKLIRLYVEQDNRIKYLRRDENGHISASSNSAISLADGEYLALLDHDDLLSVDALYWVVDELNKSPEDLPAIIYSDEDKIDAAGKRYGPYFKPDFNYELFLSQNMISHLGVYRADLVRSVGGFRAGFEGSQDWDLALRVLAISGPRQVKHIPRVLYHWRAIPGSTALHVNEKKYVVDAGTKAVQEHLDSTGQAGIVTAPSELHSFKRIQFPAPKELKYSVITVVADISFDASLFRRVMAGGLGNSRYEIIIVDQTRDGLPLNSLSTDVFQLFRVKEQFTLAEAINLGAQHASGDIFCILNEKVQSGAQNWMSELGSNAVRSGVGVVGPKIIDSNNRIIGGPLICGLFGSVGVIHLHLDAREAGYYSRSSLLQEVSALSSDCMVVSKDTFFKVGGLDEDFIHNFFSVDFCLKVISHGLRNLYDPFSVITSENIRFEGQGKPSSGNFSDLVRLREKYPQLDCDPNYNPNLDLYSYDFGLSFPSRTCSDGAVHTAYS